MKLGSSGRVGALFVSVSALLAGLLVVVPASSAQAADGVKILVVGDSISQGFAGDYTWRYRLSEHFDKKAVQFDFAGPWTNVWGGTNNYANPKFDLDHFSSYGRPYTYFTSGGNSSRLSKQVRSQKPDVVILDLGTNDIGRYHHSANTIIGHMKDAVREIRHVRNAKIVITNIPSTSIRHSGSYNQKLAAAVKKDAKKHRNKVAIADLNKSWKVGSYTFDKTHLTPVGESFEAQRIAEALHKLGIGSKLASRDILNTGLRWTPSIDSDKAEFYSDNTHAKIRWDSKIVAVWTMRIKYKLVNTGATSTRQFNVKNVKSPYWKTPKLIPGGIYRVYLKPIRGTMTAAYYGPYQQFVALGATLGEVDDLAAAPATGAVLLTWSRISGATGYLVSMSTNGGDWVVVQKNVKPTSTKLTVSVNSADGNEFQVQAMNGYIEGAKGSGASVSPSKAEPSATADKAEPSATPDAAEPSEPPPAN